MSKPGRPREGCVRGQPAEPWAARVLALPSSAKEEVQAVGAGEAEAGWHLSPRPARTQRRRPQGDRAASWASPLGGCGRTRSSAWASRRPCRVGVSPCFTREETEARSVGVSQGHQLILVLRADSAAQFPVHCLFSPTVTSFCVVFR